MAVTTYPDAAALAAYLTTAGLPPSTVAAFDTATAVAAGIQLVEERCGRKFLSRTEDETRRFDPPCNVPALYIPDLCSFTSIVYQPQTGGETVWASPENYQLLPYNAIAEARPYTRVDLGYKRWAWPLGIGVRGSISITGRFGYGSPDAAADPATTNIGFPEAVYQAMLMAGAMTLLPQNRYRETGGRVSYKAADVSEEFGGTIYADMLKQWQMTLDGAIQMYGKPEI